MGAAGRNALGISAAVLAAYVALAIAASADVALGYPPMYSGAAGEILLRLRDIWPFLAAAAVLGCVAAAIVNDPRWRIWPVVAGALAVAMRASSYRYVVPEWQEWVKTSGTLALIGAAAAGAFFLVARHRGRTSRANEL